MWWDTLNTLEKLGRFIRYGPGEKEDFSISISRKASYKICNCDPMLDKTFVFAYLNNYL